MRSSLNFGGFFALVFTLSYPSLAEGESIQLTLRHQLATETEGKFRAHLEKQQWKPSETAVIVCDMWDLHHCKNAVMRVAEMAPRMNRVLETLRAQGVLIIHAPSSCVDFYRGHPARQIALNAPQAANLPKDIGEWCHQIPAEKKGVYPIDQSDGGEDDDPVEHAAWAQYLAEMGRNPRAPWKRQCDVLVIHDHDAISDSGVEIWNLLEHRNIKNILMVGVHTNMCVLGRPFGLRQMAQNGKNVVLMRDMTDSMYNPKMWPYVNHFRGNDRIIAYIEKYVCPTVTSDQILGGTPFRFKNDPDS